MSDAKFTEVLAELRALRADLRRLPSASAMSAVIVASILVATIVASPFALR